MPLPNSRVIPRDWADHHAPLAESLLPDRCVIHPLDTQAGDWDPETGVVTDIDVPDVQLVPCRVQAAASTKAMQAEAAGQEVTTRDYLVTVARSQTPQVGQVLEVVDCSNDPSLPGRRLRIADVTRGSLIWQRDLICTDDLTV